MFTISEWDWDLEANNSSSVITCNRSDKNFDLCKMNGPTLLDKNSLTMFTLGHHISTQPHTIEKIRPYPLKPDKIAMSYVRELILTSAPPKSLYCDVKHHSPALVFSASGYNGNFYHEINENIIPLYITINSLYPNQDVILVIMDGQDWWYQKYEDLLSAFSPNHKFINFNNLTTTHCFPSATLGLIKHGPVTIDPKLLQPYPKTLIDFREFLRSVYIKNDTSQLVDPNDNKGKPRLVLVTRKGNARRVILNEEEVVKVAEDVGFNVKVFEPSRDFSMANTFRLIDSSDVMLGVHGAGLTHLVFLRKGSVMFQVVPIGLNWASETYYNKPTRFLGLEYLEYKIQANESSLSWEYGADSLVIKDPKAYTEGKWDKQLVYLKKQNVIIDTIRFRKYLIQAYNKAKIFINTTS